MKKFLSLFVLVVAIVLVSGCETKSAKEVVRTCKLVSNDVTQGYKIESEYVIYGTGKTIDKVVTTETVISDDEAILDYFEETLKSTYDVMDETYGGYDVNITNEDGKVVSKTTINYSEMDMAAYVADNSAMKSYVTEDNKLLIDGIEQVYESMGAICE